jgi:uracil-DNA glycosylase family 4
MKLKRSKIKFHGYITSKDDDICKSCPLYESKIVPSRGNIKSEIAIIGEAPGRDEDKTGMTFVGRSGKLLCDLLVKAGLEDKKIKKNFPHSDYENIALINTVKCRPPNNKINQDIIDACRSYLIHDLKKVNPNIIITLGATATGAILRDKNIVMKSIRGKVIEKTVSFLDKKVKIIPTYHPSYLLKNNNPVLKAKVVRDLGLSKHLTVGIDKKKYSLKENTDYNLASRESSIDGAVLILEREAIHNNKILALDIETRNLEYDPRYNQILCVAISYDKNKAFIFPVRGHNQSYIIQGLKRLFKNKNISWIAHNSIFDFGILGIFWKIFPRGLIHDSMIQAHLLDEEAKKDAKTLSLEYTDAGVYWEYPHSFVRSKKTVDFGDIPESILWDYCLTDSDVERQIHIKQISLLKKENLLNLYKRLLIHINKDLIYSCIRGIVIDQKLLHELKRKWFLQSRQFRRKSFQEAGRRFDINSRDDLATVLFDELSLPEGKKTPTGKSSTDKETLKLLKEHHPIINDILEYKSLNKLLGTYISGFLKYSNKDGVVHPRFKVAHTVTGRITTENPSWTNIPREGEIKKLIIAGKGRKLIYGDFKQAEMMFLAALSQDKKLMEDLKSGLDMHELATIAIFGQEYQNMKISDPEYAKNNMRHSGKTFNFALVYGAPDDYLASVLNVSQHTIEKYRENYFNTYPGMERYTIDVPNMAKTNGEIVSPFGRKRRFGGSVFDQHAHNQALNYLPQECVQEFVSLCTVDIRKEFKRKHIDGYLILMIFDAIVFSVEESRVKEAVKIIHKICTSSIPEVNNLVIGMDIGVGDSWYESSLESSKIQI